MQVLACIVATGPAIHKPHLANITSTAEPGPRHALKGRERRAPDMMAPVIILGAIMMFVFWDTSDRR
jgi:hypothetical protein